MKSVLGAVGALEKLAALDARRSAHLCGRRRPVSDCVRVLDLHRRRHLLIKPGEKSCRRDHIIKGESFAQRHHMYDHGVQAHASRGLMAEVIGGSEFNV